MDRMSNLMQLANFPPAFGGPQMPPQGMFPPAFGTPGSTGMQFSGSQQFGGAPPGIGMGWMGHPLGGGFGNPTMPPQSPFGNGGYGNGMNNLMMMHQLSNGSGYGGY